MYINKNSILYFAGILCLIVSGIVCVIIGVQFLYLPLIAGIIFTLLSGKKIWLKILTITLLPVVSYYATLFYFVNA